MIRLLYIDLFCGAGGTTTGVGTARIGGKCEYCGTEYTNGKEEIYE